MPPRCDALGARSAIDAHNVAPRYFSEDAIPRQVRLGQYNLIGLGLDPPAISCSSAKWRRPRTAFLPRVEIGCLDTRIQRYLKKTRGALGRAAIELIGIFEGQHPPCQRQVSLSRLLPLVANGCIELSNVKRPPVRVALLYAEAQGNESLLQAPQSRNCVPSRDGSAIQVKYRAGSPFEFDRDQR